MRIHHLNCGTLRPLGGKLLSGDRLPIFPARLVCHCLLLESDRGLVLVDSGFGTIDIERTSLRRLVGAGPRQVVRTAYADVVLRARLDVEETAVRRVEALGHSAADVTDVVLTHLDLDHAGGLSDFPNARVHLSAAEHAAATAPPTQLERFRYWDYHWEHGPDWTTYTPSAGDAWFGFDASELEGLPGIALVALPGHTRGHCGVAIRDDGAWLLHAGDAYFVHQEVDPVNPGSRPAAAGFQKQFEVDAAARRESRQRLRQLKRDHGDEVEMLCTHDPVELDSYH
jgi:glyoxylase-like metal-dependent hydrolase (beta-lactamase superfamily II)